MVANTLDAQGTILTITGIGFPKWSARGISQTLEPVTEATQLMRTVDGELDDLSTSQFRKYRSSISCRDFDIPAIDGLFPGMEVVVDCIVELAYVDPGDETDLGSTAARPIVEGSARLSDGYVRYRPQLTMRVERMSASRDEWAAVSSWSIDLIEK